MTAIDQRTQAIRRMWDCRMDSAAIAVALGGGFLGKTELRHATEGAKLEASIERVIHEYLDRKRAARSLRGMLPV